MNSTVPARVQARSRADSRLQSMTLGAAALGIAATGVFGYAAALTYTGKTTTVNADQQVNSFGGSGSQNSGGGSTGASGQSQPQPQTQTQNQDGFNPFFGNVNPPTSTRHHPQAVSGGS